MFVSKPLLFWWYRNSRTLKLIFTGAILLIGIGFSSHRLLQLENTSAASPSPDYCFEYTVGYDSFLEQDFITIDDYYVATAGCGLDPVIPNSINGMTVSNIASGAFQGKGLTSVDFSILNDNLYISFESFEGNQIQTLNIATGENKSIFIEDRAFANNFIEHVDIATSGGNNSIASITMGHGVFTNNQIQSASITTSVGDNSNGSINMGAIFISSLQGTDESLNFVNISTSGGDNSDVSFNAVEGIFTNNQTHSVNISTSVGNGDYSDGSINGGFTFEDNQIHSFTMSTSGGDDSDGSINGGFTFVNSLQSIDSSPNSVNISTSVGNGDDSDGSINGGFNFEDNETHSVTISTSVGDGYIDIDGYLEEANGSINGGFNFINSLQSVDGSPNPIIISTSGGDYSDGSINGGFTFEDNQIHSFTMSTSGANYSDVSINGYLGFAGNQIHSVTLSASGGEESNETIYISPYAFAHNLLSEVYISGPAFFNENAFIYNGLDSLPPADMFSSGLDAWTGAEISEYYIEHASFVPVYLLGNGKTYSIDDYPTPDWYISGVEYNELLYYYEDSEYVVSGLVFNPAIVVADHEDIAGNTLSPSTKHTGGLYRLHEGEEGNLTKVPVAIGYTLSDHSLSDYLQLMSGAEEFCAEDYECIVAYYHVDNTALIHPLLLYGYISPEDQSLALTSTVFTTKMIYSQTDIAVPSTGLPTQQEGSGAKNFVIIVPLLVILGILAASLTYKIILIQRRRKRYLAVRQSNILPK